jgi:mannose-6-phosphate isomerase-like protein (cupin superfamily)
MTPTMNFTQPQLAENIEGVGIRMSVILSTECSGGKLTIIEQEVGIGAGWPARVCNREDKVILVTGGKFVLFANGEKYEAAKGDNIFVPHGTLHSIKNVGTQTGLLLITLTPGNQKDLQKPPSQAVKVFGNSTLAMQDAAKKYNVVLD